MNSAIQPGDVVQNLASKRTYQVLAVKPDGRLVLWLHGRPRIQNADPRNWRVVPRIPVEQGPQPELIAILEDLGAGLIDIAEAARRGAILEAEPNRYRCNSCRFMVAGQCHRPGQPIVPMHPLSVRCGDYQYDDPRDHALPAQSRRNGSGLWK